MTVNGEVYSVSRTIQSYRKSHRPAVMEPIGQRIVLEIGLDFDIPAIPPPVRKEPRYNPHRCIITSDLFFTPPDLFHHAYTIDTRHTRLSCFPT